MLVEEVADGLRQFGLDRPVHERYLEWLGGAVRGFKTGMREGGEKAEDEGAAPQVTGKTVEGEVKSKTETKA